MTLAELLWPGAQAGEAIRALARHAHIGGHAVSLPPTPQRVVEGDAEASRIWTESVAACFGLEMERGVAEFGHLESIAGWGPAILQFSASGETLVLAFVGAGESTIEVVAPGARNFRLSVEVLKETIAATLGGETSAAASSILQDAHIAGLTATRLTQVARDERLRELPLARYWKLSSPIASGWWQQAKEAGIRKIMTLFLGAYALETVLWIFAWMLVGQWSLNGRLDRGWLTGWALLLLTLIPIHMFAQWQQGKVAIATGWLMMRALLEGTFQLRQEEMRSTGIGHLLGRVLESDALQSFALTGGLSAVLSSIQVVFAIAALAMLNWVLPILLAVWTLLVGVIVLFYYGRERDVTIARLNVTNEMVERMIGHRTRLAQQPRAHWHDGEDEVLPAYVEESKKADRWLIAITSLIPRGWILVAIAAIAPGAIAGGQSPAVLAGEVGGILLAFGALQSFAGALTSLTSAYFAFERAKDLLGASRRTDQPGDPALAVACAMETGNSALEMREACYRYPQRTLDALHRASVRIQKNDHVLIRGVSGSGKSTWVATAAGLRAPSSGLLFVNGIDRNTLGERYWRKVVASAPQFHENHILSGTLAFNLLLGRGWPPSPDDLKEAEAICRELGLGAMLDSMPAGLFQMVGDSGWQLSNGEKSRVYLARTLLQQSQVVILDEVLAALDPDNAQKAVDCAIKRAPTLVCVAHI